MVRMLNPPNLTIAFGMTRMHKEIVAAFRWTNRFRAAPNHPMVTLPSTLEKMVVVPIQ